LREAQQAVRPAPVHQRGTQDSEGAAGDLVTLVAPSLGLVASRQGYSSFGNCCDEIAPIMTLSTGDEIGTILVPGNGQRQWLTLAFDTTASPGATWRCRKDTQSDILELAAS
jgi:hypothetical protein